MLDSNVNKEYKDRLFRFLFGREENKEYALSLYNALNGTSYTNADELEFTTIEDVVYMGMKNDVSFMIQNFMPLYEHQSSFNPNMPLRGLMYFGKLYDRYMEKNHFNRYGKILIKIPTPQYIVFYNGLEEHEEKEILRLSDAFETNVDSLKIFLPDFDALYDAVIKNEDYKNATNEQVRKYYDCSHK